MLFQAIGAADIRDFVIGKRMPWHCKYFQGRQQNIDIYCFDKLDILYSNVNKKVISLLENNGIFIRQNYKQTKRLPIKTIEMKMEH